MCGLEDVKGMLEVVVRVLLAVDPAEVAEERRELLCCGGLAHAYTHGRTRAQTDREADVLDHALGAEEGLEQEDGAREHGALRQLVRLKVPGVERVDELPARLCRSARERPVRARVSAIETRAATRGRLTGVRAGDS
jgi:hypothetical protein